MQVFYSARQAGRNLPVVYRQGRVRFCCESMCRWWNVLVGFGGRDCPESTSREVCLYLPRPQANGSPALEVVPVDFCPWCGEPVEPCREK